MSGVWTGSFLQGIDVKLGKPDSCKHEANQEIDVSTLVVVVRVCLLSCRITVCPIRAQISWRGVSGVFGIRSVPRCSTASGLGSRRRRMLI